jgi:hypothetical protein
MELRQIARAVLDSRRKQIKSGTLNSDNDMEFFSIFATIMSKGLSVKNQQLKEDVFTITADVLMEGENGRVS